MSPGKCHGRGRAVCRGKPAICGADTTECRALRLANAGVALVLLGQPEQVWPLLRTSPDPRTRSYLTDRFAQLGASPYPLMQQLSRETDNSARAALLLSLGNFTDTQWPAANRAAAIGTGVEAIYRRER